MIFIKLILQIVVRKGCRPQRAFFPSCCVDATVESLRVDPAQQPVSRKRPDAAPLAGLSFVRAICLSNRVNACTVETDDSSDSTVGSCAHSSVRPLPLCGFTHLHAVIPIIWRHILRQLMYRPSSSLGDQRPPRLCYFTWSQVVRIVQRVKCYVPLVVCMRRSLVGVTLRPPAKPSDSRQSNNNICKSLAT